jgi:enamine deaminase RidA (YjgF/YER057c/UK114 family)
LVIRTETTNSFEEINPPALGAPRGFNHGLLVRPGWGLLFVAGQTAASTTGVVRDVAFVSQFAEALQKTIAVVQAAGGTPEHIVRMTVYVTDMDAYRDSRASLTSVWQGLMGRHYPVMALVEVSRLVDPDATVEIEATAALPPRTL